MMKIVALLIFGQCILSSALDVTTASEEIPQLVELDQRFNQLHYDVDYKLRTYRMDHSVRLKNINAQFISRYGFVVSDIARTRQHAKDEILEHALQIGGTQNPCIVAKYNETIRRASLAADVLSVTMNKLAMDLTAVTRNFFYPAVLRHQQVSTELQSAVINGLAVQNALIDLQATVEGLEAEFQENADMVDRVVLFLDHELAAFGSMMNRIRREIFTETEADLSDYISSMDKLVEEALQCE